MNEFDWIEEKDIERLPESYKEIIQIIGLKHTLALAAQYQGIPIYLHKIDKTLQQMRDEKILKEFTGGNHKELARKYNLTEARIRQILTQDHSQELDQSNQLDLFSMMNTQT